MYRAAADHPFPITYSAQTLLDELASMRPVVLRDGELVDVEPLSGKAERELPELGAVEGIYTLHSELATLPAAFPSSRGPLSVLSSPGLTEKLLALGEGEGPEPYDQSRQSVAVHLVDLEGAGRVVGWALTRGGSARSTSEPAARAAFELLEGRMSFTGARAPEAAIPDPEAFLALLDTEVYWDVT